MYSLVACNYNAYIKYVFGCVFVSLGHPKNMHCMQIIFPAHKCMQYLFGSVQFVPDPFAIAIASVVLKPLLPRMLNGAVGKIENITATETDAFAVAACSLA